MSKRKLKKLAALIAMISVSLLLGCGKTEPPPDGGGGGGAPPAPPPPPSVCVPLGQPISFTATNVYFIQPWYAGTIAMGQIPPNNSSFLPIPIEFSGKTYGQVSVTPGQQTSSGYWGSFQGRNTKGDMIQISVISGQGTPQGQYPYSPSYYPQQQQGTVSLTGTIYTMANAFNTQQYPYPLPGQPQQPVQPQVTCVSSVAAYFSIRNGNQLYIGNVYLYTNNSPHGIVLEF
ncbi:MAG: hypothetical protein HY843_08145 [Bdellovibrio sp.]|nr:hypothetical protein [Bdellovibrio sp.]